MLSSLPVPGVSAESGVPTFRDAQTGLWERFDAEELATTEAYVTDKTAYLRNFSQMEFAAFNQNMLLIALLVQSRTATGTKVLQGHAKNPLRVKGGEF
jgi:NAD-dependent SIR2 family protein deacetylase